MSPKNPSTSSPNLLDLPHDVRKKILLDVLLDPISPNFEATTPPTSTSYSNYFAIAFVNRQLQREANDALAKSKALVYGIPTVSTSRAAKLKHFAMRVHVTYPKKADKVVTSIIILSSELANLSRLLRIHSLSIRHSDQFPVNDEDTKKFPRMALKIRFGDGTGTTKDEQIALLKQMAFADRVGPITILKPADPSVHDILPGSTYTFTPSHSLPNNPMLVKRARDQWFRNLRKQDGNDQLEIYDWCIMHAIKATLAMNHSLAIARYELVRDLIRIFFDKNRFVGHPSMDFQLKIDMRENQAAVGLARSRTLVGESIKLTFTGAMMAGLNLGEVRDERGRECAKFRRRQGKGKKGKGDENGDGEEEKVLTSSMPSFEVRLLR
ncbi:hypothetical protein HYFRA_00002172 [Hymenoscyphus fraxineus]|uniref:Uncharacterized protein n=1 Tax=Hymenoscyphus fraxineus TaxID=746836 RepID=A0A9N9PMT8_9HELO|nr:hypothetical protein HYFRA_00002172 [Hymenoscyphus fraxineus]